MGMRVCAENLQEFHTGERATAAPNATKSRIVLKISWLLSIGAKASLKPPISGVIAVSAPWSAL